MTGLIITIVAAAVLLVAVAGISAMALRSARVEKENALSMMKASNDAVLAEVRESYERTLAELKAGHQREISELRKSHEQALNTQLETVKAQVTADLNGHQQANTRQQPQKADVLLRGLPQQ